jgi:hypothetical protein
MCPVAFKLRGQALPDRPSAIRSIKSYQINRRRLFVHPSKRHRRDITVELDNSLRDCLEGVRPTQ